MRFTTRLLTFASLIASIFADKDVCKNGSTNDKNFFQPPKGLTHLAPGTIIRSRTIEVNTTALPMLQAVGKTYQIVYRSQGFDESQAQANVLTLLVPKGYDTSKADPIELVLGSAAYDTNNPNCGPSRSIPAGSVMPEWFNAGIQLASNRMYAFADFEGPKAAFSQGNVAAAGNLDALRAILSFQEVVPQSKRGNVKIALEGYSGGGQAVAFTLQRMPSYAPELQQHIIAASMGGVPANLAEVSSYQDQTRTAGFILLALFGQAKVDSRIKQWIEKHGIADQIKKAKSFTETLCIDKVLAPFANQSIFQQYFGMTKESALNDPSLPVSESTLADQSVQKYPIQPITTPTFLFQSIQDQFVPVKTADEYYDRLCKDSKKAKLSINYVRSTTEKHLGLQIVSIPYSAIFLEQRFKGAPPTQGCQRSDQALKLDDPRNVAAFGQPTIDGLQKALQVARSEE